MIAGEDGKVTELEKAYMLQYPENSAQNPVVDENGQLVTAVDFDEAFRTFNRVINDAEIGKYDVAVGEGPFAETVRISNFLALTDLASQGVPIPPSTLIDMSLIPENEKKKIMAQIDKQQQVQAQVAAQQAELEKAGVQIQQAELQMEDKHKQQDINIDQQEVDIKKFEAMVKARQQKGE